MPSKDVKAKAIRLVRDHAGDYDMERPAIRAISSQLGISAETLRKWLRQVEVDAGLALGVPTKTAQEIRKSGVRNAELERTK